ncbi:MAG TPA: hypothetical protein PLO37_25335 [Candidatus Hydrogenedentes bacterium]|nr:hypothetical protein [Candidatus Hydrogenedentota bacterium]
MKTDLVILVIEAMSAYLLVLLAHSLRSRVGLAHFYALIGGLTAVMSWVTDAGVRVDVAGISFMVGSTVFYTALLLGVFVVYVFDGPRATRVAISTIAGVSIMVPLIAFVLHQQVGISGHAPLGAIPVPSLRINTASVLATVADLVFLAVAWEFLGKPRLRIPLWLRSFLTLLGVMWLDVFLFSTGAFAGKAEYVGIMSGTLLSRLVISVFAYPLLYLYLNWQNKKVGIVIEHRPVLAILTEITEMKAELSLAQREIERRKRVEREKEDLIEELRHALSEVKTLRGFLPICANCGKIRNDQGCWQPFEAYVQQHSEAMFSHSICTECARLLYPEYRPSSLE